MLVLRRKSGESIVLGDGAITIYVLGIEGDRVKVGIDAPADVSIVRSELLEDVANRRQVQPKRAYQEGEVKPGGAV